MKKLFPIFCLACSLMFIGCTPKKGTDAGSSLPVIDVNKEYPVKRIDIHELAEVTYIPLETTDSSLLQIFGGGAISDSIIVAFDILQSQFGFFDEKGNYLHTVNRFGQGTEEYYGVTRCDVDFEKKELYVCAIPNKIYTYDFDGTYKNAFKLPKNIAFVEDIVNYDADYLLTFNDSYKPSPDKLNREADKEPFYLINKKDGTVRNIDKRLRTEKPVHHIFQIVKGQSGRYSLSEGFQVNHILKNGSDCLLTNNALDTLYNYKNHQLEPVFVRTPSASTMDVPKLITPFAYTDAYFMFGIVPMDYEIGKKYYFDERMAPHYILDRKTNEIFQVILYDSLLDPEFDVKDKRDAWNIFPHHTFMHLHSKNQGVGHYKTELVLEKLNEGKLSGKLKEMALKLKEDDNNCIAIYKFK